MAYTTINKSTDYFNTKLYTGTGSAPLNITGLDFQPDFNWTKNRSTAGGYSHNLCDVVRGTTKYIKSNSSNAEQTDSNNITSFNSDGYTLGFSTNGEHNVNGHTYASWNWKANGAGSANTDGDINSTVSANTTAGFSIVKYSGNSTSNQTIGHGLGSTPKMIIIKRLTNTNSWITYHSSLGATKMIFIDQTSTPTTSAAPFNNTSPTNSVFTVDGNGGYNPVNVSSNDYIAYCFAEKTGYSKFGSYTGNGNADGTFVYTGFKPAFIMLKNTETAGNNWVMIDNKRLGYNVDNNRIYADLSNAEDTTDVIDIVSNGFKHRFTGGTSNGSGDNYIYMAFAEAPLVGSNNVPCTAR